MPRKAKKKAVVKSVGLNKKLERSILKTIRVLIAEANKLERMIKTETK